MGYKALAYGSWDIRHTAVPDTFALLPSLDCLFTFAFFLACFSPASLATNNPRSTMSRKPHWFYPFRGITYFLSNPGLWPRVILPFILLLLISIALIVLAFIYLFPLQVDYFIRHNWASWLAKCVSGLLTLVEAALGSLVFYLALMPLWEDGKLH